MSKLNLELGRSSRMLESSIQQLSQLLGVNDLNNFEFINEETDGIEIPAYNEIIGLVSNNPELVMNTNVLKRDDMNILYQESLAIPDLSVGLGIRRINETNDNALVAGISFALPLFNANKGHIEEAYIKKDRNKSLYDLEKLKLQQSLTEAYNKMANNTSSIKMLTEDIIPQAERAVIILEDGYKEGRYTLLEVLDSQRTLLELEIEYFNAVMEYNNNLFEIEKIIGQSLTGISREKHNNE
jgi:cobalt-zinc-cadmium efflux system outer membrane protein